MRYFLLADLMDDMFLMKVSQIWNRESGGVHLPEDADVDDHLQDSDQSDDQVGEFNFWKDFQINYCLSFFHY